MPLNKGYKLLILTFLHTFLNNHVGFSELIECLNFRINLMYGINLSTYPIFQKLYVLSLYLVLMSTAYTVGNVYFLNTSLIELAKLL